MSLAAITHWRIPFNRPYSGRRLGEHVATVAASTHHSGDGPMGRRCQEWLEALHGTPTVLTPSCTHALELAALALDVGPGDEVIVPSFTFTSTATAFALRGATLRFADVDPATFGIDPASVEQRLTDRTKAIVAVHYAGIPCDVRRLAELAERSDAAIVEDNAHGLFSTLDGKRLGTFGRLSSLSFHETKNVSCGEGGALIVNDVALLDRVQIARDKGTNRHAYFRGEVDKYTWVDLGSSWLPSELTSAALLAAFEDAEATQARRHRAWSRYHEELASWANCNGIQTPVVAAGVEHPAHLYFLVFAEAEHRHRFIDHMACGGVQVVFHYQPLNTTDAARRFGVAEACPISEAAGARLVRLPLFANLTDAEVEWVIELAQQFSA